MTHLSHDQVNAPIARGEHAAAKPAESPRQVQMIFVGVLLFIVLSVSAEYLLGEFAGLNIGQDFGVILGGTVAFGIVVGLAAAMLHRWNQHRRSE